jgi:hypothetical protein
MWIFQDLRRAWQYTYNQSAPYYIDPGAVSVVWENDLQCYPTPFNCNSFFYTFPEGYIFIKHDHRDSADIVIHEVGHNYMYNKTGWVDGNCPSPHSIRDSSNINCAWSEGWAEFFPVVANLSINSTDVCYDFDLGHCVLGSVNLETIGNADTGDAVEGRVASALFDLYDNANEGYDSASFGFAPIAKIVLQGSAEYNFLDFWNSWKASGFNRHHAVRAIYQNTINYNTPPILYLPDWNVPHDSSWSNAFNLLNYVSDVESAPSDLTWQIASVSDTRCGVSIDAQKNIDIAPQANWQGFCDISIRANDSISATIDTFRVHVTQASFADVPPTHGSYSWIERVYAAGITAGCANDPRRYCPDNAVTRAEMAVFLLRGIHGSGYTPPPPTGTMFLDVPISHPFAAWIEQLANEGITGGCGSGNYCPSNSVTRAQMAIFLLRSKYGSGYTPPPATGTMFADVPANAFAAAWIEQLANEGITGGCGGGNFCPNSAVTRAQMAIFLVRTFDLP